MIRSPLEVYEDLWNGIKETIMRSNRRPAQKAYIAGPISNDPDYKEKFDHAEGVLKDAGYIVLNPAWQPLGLEYEQYMAISGEMLDCCNHIFLLSDWEESAGAKEELKKSLERGIEVHDFWHWNWLRLNEKKQERKA